MKISQYLDAVRKTDKLPPDKLSPVLFGLYGEIGELLTLAKKKYREQDIYTNDQYTYSIRSEIGDAFWYLCCLVNRLNLNPEEIFKCLPRDLNSLNGFEVSSFSNGNLDALLGKLGKITGDLLDETKLKEDAFPQISLFLQALVEIVNNCQISFGDILKYNMNKIKGRFALPESLELPTFDGDFPEFEQLPNRFEIEFTKISNNRQALRWNGVFIGDPLTDSIENHDGYRFHDVFHLANAAVLHWSPVFRSLIKHKRKSKNSVDEAQDGGRAIVVEEGVSAWVFNIAKKENFFKNRDSLTFDMLKFIKEMTKGFEVEKCPLSLWERTILKGYEVFRYIKENDGGVVIGDKAKRTINYKNSNGSFP